MRQSVLTDAPPNVLFVITGLVPVIHVFALAIAATRRGWRGCLGSKTRSALLPGHDDLGWLAPVLGHYEIVLGLDHAVR